MPSRSSPSSSRARGAIASGRSAGAAGAAAAVTVNCGVRVVEGQHRSYVTDFIRDARAGGCAAGIPPSNLGFRLVREPKLFMRWFGL